MSNTLEHDSDMSKRHQDCGERFPVRFPWYTPDVQGICYQSSEKNKICQEGVQINNGWIVCIKINAWDLTVSQSIKLGTIYTILLN